VSAVRDGAAVRTQNAYAAANDLHQARDFLLIKRKIRWHAAAEDLFNLHTVEPPKLVARR
jgi:hypothetical protein